MLTYDLQLKDVQIVADKLGVPYEYAVQLILETYSSSPANCQKFEQIRHRLSLIAEPDDDEPLLVTIVTDILAFGRASCSNMRGGEQCVLFLSFLHSGRSLRVYFSGKRAAMMIIAGWIFRISLISLLLSIPQAAFLKQTMPK